MWEISKTGFLYVSLYSLRQLASQILKGVRGWVASVLGLELFGSTAVVDWVCKMFCLCGWQEGANVWRVLACKIQQY